MRAFQTRLSADQINDSPIHYARDTSALINHDVRALLSFFFNNLTYIISPVDEDDDDDDTLNMGIMQCIKYAAQS